MTPLKSGEVPVRSADILHAPLVTPRFIGFLTAAAAAGIGTMVVGVDGNPVGLTLLYLAAVLVVGAFVLRWRRPKCFVRLVLGEREICVHLCSSASHFRAGGDRLPCHLSRLPLRA